MDKKFLEGQGRGNLMDLPRPFFLKKSLFYKLWAWQVPNNATPFSFRNFNVHYQGFKMRYCLFLYYKQFLNNSLKCMKKSTSILLLVHSNRSYLQILSGTSKMIVESKFNAKLAISGNSLQKIAKYSHFHSMHFFVEKKVK